jgi:N-acetylglucosaminyl-diphospho-decaprenol L-rhamnosyltransferase
MTTGVVVVTYNSADVIGRCLDSCAHLSIVVVDNNSGDETLSIVRKKADVKLIANSSNRGFAAAANQGVEALDTELILLLNPDVELSTSVERLADACSAEGVGLATGRLLDESGRVQAGFTLRRFPSAWTLAFEALGINSLFPSNAVNRRYRCLDVDLSKPSEVEQPPGAFLMFRREVWHRLGGFDTQFSPLWFEDVDFSKRACDIGVKILYVPEVTARHQGGHSIAGLNWECRQVYWYASLLRYASKHFTTHAFRGVAAAVVLGSMFRAVIETIRRGSFGPISVYAKVVKLALSSKGVGQQI